MLNLFIYSLKCSMNMINIITTNLLEINFSRIIGFLSKLVV